MPFLPRLRAVIPAAALTAGLTAALFTGCAASGKKPAVKANLARSTTAAQVRDALSRQGIRISGSVTCVGRAPGVIDCTGTTSDGRPLSATLTATVSGTTCTGPLVVNVGGSQVASEASAKCS